MTDYRLAEAKLMNGRFEYWKRIGLGVKGRMDDDNLSLVAAGVSFYVFLSIFPALASILSIYGIVASTADVAEDVATLSIIIPADVLDIIKERISNIASNQESSLTLGLVGGLALSLWSANKAMKAVADALNVAYDVSENRGFIKKNIVTMTLTIFASLAAIASLTVIVILPLVVTQFLSNDTAELTTKIVSWIVLILIMFAIFLILYKFAPNRKQQVEMVKLVSGAIFSTVMFVVSSLLFSIYVSNFGKYDEEYGALGTVVVTLLWLFLGAYIFLIGAELNAQRNLGAKPDNDP